MATILEFPLSQRPARQALRATSTPAEIVFFPGVRYERWLEKPAAKQRKRCKPRDQIELEG